MLSGQATVVERRRRTTPDSAEAMCRPRAGARLIARPPRVLVTSSTYVSDVDDLVIIDT